MRVGTYSGKTSSDKSSPPRLIPTVRAAPKAPIIDRAGVPKAKLITSGPYPAPGRFKRTPSIGATSTKGRPVVTQWATALTATTPSNGSGEVANRSSAPSSQSTANNRSSDKRHANSAPNHSTPAAIRDNNSDEGPTENGTNTTTIRKNAKPRPKPPPARSANCKSRIKSALIRTPRPRPARPGPAPETGSHPAHPPPAPDRYGWQSTPCRRPPNARAQRLRTSPPTPHPTIRSARPAPRSRGPSPSAGPTPSGAFAPPTDGPPGATPGPSDQTHPKPPQSTPHQKPTPKTANSRSRSAPPSTRPHGRHRRSAPPHPRPSPPWPAATPRRCATASSCPTRLVHAAQARDRVTAQNAPPPKSAHRHAQRSDRKRTNPWPRPIPLQRATKPFSVPKNPRGDAQHRGQTAPSDRSHRQHRQGNAPTFAQQHIIGPRSRGRRHDLDAHPGLFQRGAQIGRDMGNIGPGAQKQHIHMAHQFQQRSRIRIAAPRARAGGAGQGRALDHVPANAEKSGAIALNGLGVSIGNLVQAHDVLRSRQAAPE
mmetsp:Transcript_22933/g.38566  ORF Transcript_22933/g.38566 Transcript_22933/m.38566 type:complete len:540 (+) Transcript_22933:820-2439(+)